MAGEVPVAPHFDGVHVMCFCVEPLLIFTDHPEKVSGQYLETPQQGKSLWPHTTVEYRSCDFQAANARGTSPHIPKSPREGFRSISSKPTERVGPVAPHCDGVHLVCGG
jgi:hypothetical protein